MDIQTQHNPDQSARESFVRLHHASAKEAARDMSESLQALYQQRETENQEFAEMERLHNARIHDLNCRISMAEAACHTYEQVNGEATSIQAPYPEPAVEGRRF